MKDVSILWKLAGVFRSVLVLSLLFAACGGRAEAADTGAEPNVFAEYFPQYNGLIVRRIEVNGLKRSRPGIVRWMLGAREGEPFDARAWQNGVDRLYKTEAIFEIHSEIVKTNEGGATELEIRVFMRDKWTLFPYFEFQGGGGALSLEAGVFDSNLLGTFSNFFIGGGYLDNTYSYNVGISQKWFLETSYSAGVQFSKIMQPVTLQNANGQVVENFTWSRAEQEISIGKQNGEDVYWEIHAAAFRDSLRNPVPSAVSNIFPELGQYRLAPSIKLWKVAHSDYLEQGQELTIAGSLANFANPDRDYHAVTLSWKQVFYLPETRNIAYYLSVGHMSSAPIAYQFRLGGFDSVRGFSMNRTLGLDNARANLEYRTTLWSHRFEFLDLDRVIFQGCLFTDTGTSWNSAGMDPAAGVSTQSATRFLYSVGTGIRAIALRFSNATIRLDLARSVVPNEGFNVGFGVGQFF